MKRNITIRTTVCTMICLASLVMMGTGGASAYNNEILKLSAMMADRIIQTGIQTVAVADFTDLQGNVTELGRFLAEHISVALAGSGRRLMVVDRTHIRTLLKEHKLSSTGLIDPATARQLGKVAGVEALITGTITPFGDTIDMTIKVLHTETAKIIDASTVNIAATEAIKVLLKSEIATEWGNGDNLGGVGKVSKVRLKVQKQVEADGRTFALEVCRRTGQSVTCTFFVTSNDEERNLGIHGSYGSRIFDDLGYEYRATYVQIGDQSGETQVETLLPIGIPIKASLKFKNVSLQANFLTMLDISAYRGYDGDFHVQFRNVPFSR